MRWNPSQSDVTFFRALLHLLPSPLLILYPFFSWRTILGLPTDCSHVSFSTLPGSQLNLTAVCNAECGCLQETYSPVCGSNDVMYYSPCHAGCRKVSENLRNGKKVCPTAPCIDKAAAHYLWNVLAGSAKAWSGLGFVASQWKRQRRHRADGGCVQEPHGRQIKGSWRSPWFASLNVPNFDFASLWVKLCWDLWDVTQGRRRGAWWAPNSCASAYGACFACSVHLHILSACSLQTRARLKIGNDDIRCWSAVWQSWFLLFNNLFWSRCVRNAAWFLFQFTPGAKPAAFCPLQIHFFLKPGPYYHHAFPSNLLTSPSFPGLPWV